MLRIYLFGGFLLQLGDKALPPIPSRVARSLFSYLVTNLHREHTRDLLAGTFWPELDESRARRRLSHALWQIQSVLGEIGSPEPYIIATADTVRFNTDAPFWLDVGEFQSLLGEDPDEGAVADVGALIRAVDLYRGDFLAGFYDDWGLVERESLRQRYLGSLSRLVQFYKASGDYEQGLVYARRVVIHDPLREEAHREVMRLCFLAGRFNEALQQYERCCSILEEELGAEPDRATTALYRDILERRRKSDPPFVPAPQAPLLEGPTATPLVGRADERTALLGRMQDTLAGRGGVVLVEGEPGVGKSRLLRAMAEDAHWRGLGVLWGESRELETYVPYSVLVRALEGGLSALRVGQLVELVDEVWLREAARLIGPLLDHLPELLPPPPLKTAEEGERLREALLRIVEAFGLVSPHVVVLEDVQWADADSLRILGLMGERLAASGVLLVLSYRSSEARERPEAWETLLALDGTVGTKRLEIVPLAPEETAELIQRSLGWTGAPSSFVDAVYHDTGGNPLLVLETLKALHEQTGTLLPGEVGEAVLDTTAPEEAELPLGSGVTSVIEGRLERLSPGVRTVLEGVSVLEAADTPGLVRLSERPSLEVLADLDEALRRGLLVDEGDGFRFSHAQMRRVVYHGMPETARRDLHRRAAEYLEELHHHRVDALAHHYSRAEVPDKAFEYLSAAGERAVAVHAYEIAARHYAQALASGGFSVASRERRYEVLSIYEGVLDVLGRRDEQSRIIESLTREVGDDPRLRPELAVRKARYYANVGRFAEAEHAARAAVASATEHEVARPLVELGLVLSRTGRYTDAIGVLESAIASGDPTVTADGRYALGLALSYVQRHEEAEDVLRQAGTIYESLHDRRGVVEVASLLAVIAAERGNTGTAMSALRNAIDIAREIGYRGGEAVNLVNLASLCHLTGRVGQALEHFEQARSVMRSIGDRRGEATALANRASMVHRVLGDDGAASEDARRALAYYREIGDGLGQALCLSVLGGVARRRGDLAGAGALIEEGLSAVEGSSEGWLTAQLLRSSATVALDAGRPSEALVLVERAETMCADLGLPDLLISIRALRIPALLAIGEEGEALALARRLATEDLQGVEQGYLVSLWCYQAMDRAGETEEARRLLAEAHGGLLEALADLGEEEQRAAIEGVPEHRAITAAWRGTEPTLVTIRLPAAAAALGRTLRDRDMVEVVLTIAEPADAELSGPEQRRARLRRVMSEAAAQGALARVEDLAAALDVSVATIRRDLAILRRSGQHLPTRGSQ